MSTMTTPAPKAARTTAREAASGLRFGGGQPRIALHKRPPILPVSRDTPAEPHDVFVSNPLAQLRADLGWSRPRLAQIMNCSDRALVNWEQGEPMSAIYAAKLRELQDLFAKIEEIMPPREIGPWLLTDMEEFDHLSPADLIRRGETGRLWASLFYLRSGLPD